MIRSPILGDRMSLVSLWLTFAIFILDESSSTHEWRSVGLPKVPQRPKRIGAARALVGGWRHRRERRELV